MIASGVKWIRTQVRTQISRCWSCHENANSCGLCQTLPALWETDLVCDSTTVQSRRTNDWKNQLAQRFVATASLVWDGPLTSHGFRKLGHLCVRGARGHSPRPNTLCPPGLVPCHELLSWVCLVAYLAQTVRPQHQGYTRHERSYAMPLLEGGYHLVVQGCNLGESRFHFPYQTRTSVGCAIGNFLSLQFIKNFCLLDPQLRSYLVRRLDGVYLKDGICEWQVHEH